MAKPTRRFTANVGDPSTGNAGPDAIEEDLDKIFAMFNPAATLPVTGEVGGIGTENLQEGAVTDDILAATARRVLKGVVTYVTDLPSTGNAVGDLYLVTDASGGVPALYVYSSSGWMVLTEAAVDYAAKFDGSSGHKHTGATGDAPPVAKVSDSVVTETGAKVRHDGNIAIIMGEVDHGSVLPLPPGYTKDQCKWIVSPKNPKGDWYNPNPIVEIQCWVNPDTLVVTCQAGDSAPTPVWRPSKAHYLVIGIK